MRWQARVHYLKPLTYSDWPPLTELECSLCEDHVSYRSLWIVLVSLRETFVESLNRLLSNSTGWDCVIGQALDWYRGLVVAVETLMITRDFPGGFVITSSWNGSLNIDLPLHCTESTWSNNEREDITAHMHTCKDTRGFPHLVPSNYVAIRSALIIKLLLIYENQL